MAEDQKILLVYKFNHPDVESLRAVLSTQFPANPVELLNIKTMVKRGAGGVRVIQESLDGHAYAAVAVGRSGADAPPRRSFFTGSVPRQLLRDLEGCSLWVIP